MAKLARVLVEEIGQIPAWALVEKIGQIPAWALIEEIGQIPAWALVEKIGQIPANRQVFFTKMAFFAKCLR